MTPKDVDPRVWELATKRAKAMGYISLWSMDKCRRQKFLDDAFDELNSP